MFTIDFTKPWLYKDIIYFNQGNLSTNNTLRCKLVTGGSDDFTGGSIACTFTTKDSVEISGFGKLVDAKNGIIDIVFPSNALVVGTNKLEVLVNRVDGGVAQSPPVMYDIWQGLTTGNGVEAETNYPILIQLINSVNEASNQANATLDRVNAMQTDVADAIDNAYRSANEADIATSNANTKIDEVESSKLEMIEKVNTSIGDMKNQVNTSVNNKLTEVENAKTGMISQVNDEISNMKTQVNSSTDTMTSKVDDKISDVNKAIAAGTNDLEVKEARKEYATLNERLEADLRKGKLVEETKEGTYLSFNDTVGGLVSYLEVLGNTVQDVSNLANIRSSCIPNGDGTFKMSILSVGENLLNENEIIQDKYVDKNTGNIENSATYNCSPFVRINGGKDLFISKLYASSALVICFYDKNKKFISYIDQLSVCNKPFRSPANACYLVYTLSKDWANNIVSEGTVATPYTPYQETRCDIKLPCQLEKVGDVADRLYFDKEENAWCVDDNNIDLNVNSCVVTGVSSTDANTIRVSIEFDSVIKIPTGDSLSVICDKLPPNLNFAKDEMGIFVASLSDKKLFLRINKSELNNDFSYSNVKKWLVDNIKCLKVNAKTPQKIVLPQSEQIKLNSFANKTHIYTMSGEVDATVKATVSKSLASTVQANTNEINNLSSKIADIEGLKETQDFSYELPNGQNYLVCKDTQTGVVKDLKIKGVTKLIDNEGNEVEPGTPGATLASVGNGNEIEVLSVNDGNLFDGEFEKCTINPSTGELNLPTTTANVTTVNLIPVISGVQVKYKSTGARGFRSGANSFVYYYDENKAFTKREVVNTFESIIIPSECRYIRLVFNDVDLNSSFGKENYNIVISQLGKLDNQNFVKQDKKPILFKDTDGKWKPVTELRGLDFNRCDIVDSSVNKMYIKYVEKTIDNTLSFIEQTTLSGQKVFITPFSDIKEGSNYDIDLLCDSYKCVSSNELWCTNGTMISCGFNDKEIRIKDETVNSVEELKSKLAIKPIRVVVKLAQEKVYEVNPLEIESFDNETMILIDGGAIAPKAEWKITSSLPNFVKSIQDQVRQLQDQVYKTNVANFTVALNTLDTKLRLDRLEAPQM